MKKREGIIFDTDDLLGLISALALAQNVSESEVTTEDIRNLCAECGWNDPTLVITDKGLVVY